MSSRYRLAALLLAAACGAHAQGTDTAAKNSALSSELFYQLLVGELSVRNEDPGTGFSLILDAARKTGDARLYQRATEIALRARAGDSALQAARSWKQALPNSREANRYVLQIVVALNRLSEAPELLKREITLAPARERQAVIQALPQFFVRVTDKKQVAAVLEQALAEQLDSTATGPAAWTAIGRMRMEAGDQAGALEAARRGHTLNTKAEEPVWLALALMHPTRPQAEALVRRHLDGASRPELRMDYVRRLLEMQRYADAKAQIQQLLAEKPDFADAWLVRGTLELQAGRLAQAEPALLHYVSLLQNRPAEEQGRGLTQAYLSLAHVAEQRSDFVAAESWLARINNPQDLVRVQSRRASLWARQGRLEEARGLLRELPERNPAEARIKLNAEVQLLRDNKQYRAAYDLLTNALQNAPRDHELLYDQALLAEKLGDLADMERLLRQAIEVKPDYHHAYNALGYSLAEHGLRLDEARALILKALEFAPDDPFINDSLGWLEFRRGNPAEAVRILQKAYQNKPDAEIAAHLGEVLWSMGRRDQALVIWKDALGLNADNETLRETLKRLGVQP